MERKYLSGNIRERLQDLMKERKITQSELAAKIGKPVIFVNVSGSCVNLSFKNENFDAVIQCFYPGAEGGKALADIIFGKVSPSGRLPVTFYKSVDDLPPFEDYSMDNRTCKFFKGDVVYPFGHGLTYSEITEEWTDENTVVLENKGKYDVTSNQCIHIHTESHKHDYKSNQMDYKRNGCILCRTGHIVKPVQYGICDRGPAVQHYNDSSKHEKIGRRCT